MNKVRLALVGALVLGLTMVARADEEKGEKSDLKGKLVGTWEVVKSKGKEGGPPPGATFEFTKGGKVLVTFEAEGKKVRGEATYKVEGKGLTITMKRGDEAHTQTVKVVKVDDKELVVRNEKEGREVTLKRKKAKPKD
jgi:uncharacterized protein (TIGR03066 family)